MEVIEIMIYIVIALIVGSMVLVFIRNIDYDRIQDDITLKDEEELKFEKVTKEEFIGKMLQFWDETGMCSINNNATFYVYPETGPNNINKTYIFDQIKELNFCATLQSSAKDCGENEDIQGPISINLPKVIRLSCNPTNNELILQ